MNSIKLIDIKADERYSGSTLDWTGLQAALQMIRRGRANMLLVAKLDRLSRSLRDVCSLVDEMFSDERYLRAPRDRDREIHGIVTGHSRPS